MALDLSSPKALNAFRIYSIIAQALIVPTLIGTLNIYTEFVSFKNEVVNLKENIRETKTNQAVIEAKLLSGISEEKQDRIREIGSVRADLSQLQNEYYSDFPRNFNRFNKDR